MRITALVLTAVLALTQFAGCTKEKEPQTTPENTQQEAGEIIMPEEKKK